MKNGHQQSAEIPLRGDHAGSLHQDPHTEATYKYAIPDKGTLRGPKMLKIHTTIVDFCVLVTFLHLLPSQDDTDMRIYVTCSLSLPPQGDTDRRMYVISSLSIQPLSDSHRTNCIMRSLPLPPRG